MKILYLTGGAGQMYCGSCLRDNALAAELMRQGHDVTLLPFYTPTLTDETNVSRQERDGAGHSHAPLLAAADTPLRGARLGRARPLVVGAAALLAGVGAWLLHGKDQTADALDPYVAMAADVLDWKPKDFETCAQGKASDVHSFALVIDGELQVTGCATKTSDKNASVAVLRRPEELPIVGYVAVPASGTAEAGVVGITEVDGGRVVVFDVVDHGRRVYLAVNPATLRAKYPEPGYRWSCAACHGPARQVLPNPHRIVLRRGP